MAMVEESIGRAVKLEKRTAAEAAAALDRISIGTDLQSLSTCDLVIESVSEDRQVKRNVLARFDKVCSSEAIYASTTSSFRIDELSDACNRPDRVVGFHVFVPVPAMSLVEVSSSETTNPAIAQTVVQFAKSVGKIPIQVSDQAGFLVNRLLYPYLLDAVRLLESGIATKEDIDGAMTFGCNMPLGPLALLDLIGLDVSLQLASSLYEAYNDERYEPPKSLKAMVKAGRLGRKTGSGIYDY